MEPLSAREERKLQDEIARQQRQERLAGQQKLVKESQLQKQQKRQQDMVQHQQVSGQWLSQLESAPTFFPTVDEFTDPIAYIRSIQTEGSKHGICKIVPPVVPTVPSGLVLEKADGSKLNFSTREQVVQQLRWETLDTARFYDSGKTYTIKDYEKLADEFQRRRFGLAGCLPAKMVEADYWRQMLGSDNPLVEYGNDVEGTAFCSADADDPLSSSSWNLQILPHVSQSTLRLLRGDAPGVSSPMLYIGMLFATFAWHVEDHYLYSINYQHLGAAKTWYGVPANDADAFEDVARRHVYTEAVAAAVAEGKSEAEVANAVHAALLGKTTMFTPKLLTDNGVKVRRVVQAPGEYVITFPRAYHGGFSNGFCVGEAVNFSIGDWFPFGLEAAQRYRRLSRLPVLAHDELLCLEGLAIHEGMKESSEEWQHHPQADMHATLMRCFVQLVREQHAQRAELTQRGLTQTLRLPFSASMPCCRCKGMMYLAEVLSGDEWSVPVCLACALAYPLAGTCPFRIQLHPEVAHLEDVAQSFEQLLRQPNSTTPVAGKEQGLDTTGLTETFNFGLPLGSLDTGSALDPFDWSAAPALESPYPKQDPHDDWPVPDELMACQQDAPEPPGVTPSRSGHRAGKAGALRGAEAGPSGHGAHAKASSSSGKAYTSSGGLPPQLLPTCHNCGEEIAGATGPRQGVRQCQDCERSNPSSQTHAPLQYPEQAPPGNQPTGPGQTLNLKPVAVRRTPRKRTLTLQDQDMVDTPMEARGHVRGSREMSRDDSSDAQEQETARFLNGLRGEEDAQTASGASGDRPYVSHPRGLGKRPSSKWTKLGSDAESPPGKRAKNQVPGVKAANGTYIPPGPMLNSASTRLACLEDVEVDVSATGSPARLFRRRVFAPEDNRDERFLTASDVVKGSGFETNTSASNIIDRWTREACAIIVRHNNRNGTDLPMPELPARAYCAGMASSCYVLKAVDVEMLMLPGVLKDDLRANLQRFIADVWPRSAYPAPRGIAGQPQAKESARSSRAGSRQPSGQPQALPYGNDRVSRHGGNPDGAMRDRAGSNASGGSWSRADASSPAPTRVLRKRDPKGRSGAPAGRGHDMHYEWDDNHVEHRDASQGLDVLAGLAETALSEANKGWDLADPPQLERGTGARQGRLGPTPPPQMHPQPPQRQTQTQAEIHLPAQSHASAQARNGQAALYDPPAQGQHQQPALPHTNDSALRQLPEQLPAQLPADASQYTGSSHKTAQHVLGAGHQGQGQHPGQFMSQPQVSQAHAQPQFSQYQGLPQHQRQQLLAHPRQHSYQLAPQFQARPSGFSQGFSQAPQPGPFQTGQPQGHNQAPDHAHRQMQQHSMATPFNGIIRPQAVRSQGFTMHRGVQQSPAGQLQPLPPLPNTSSGSVGPQTLLPRQAGPHSLGMGPPTASQGQSDSHDVKALQSISQQSLPNGSSMGQGQPVNAPASMETQQATSYPSSQLSPRLAQQSLSAPQHAQSRPLLAPNVSQYGAPQFGQIMPQSGHSMAQHGHSVSQPRQHAPQQSASEAQPHSDAHLQSHPPGLDNVPRDLSWPPADGFAAQLQSFRATGSSPQLGPSATAPAASSAPSELADSQQLQSCGSRGLPREDSQHEGQQQAPSLQAAGAMPISWEDTRQAASQVNAHSFAAEPRQSQQPNSYQGYNKGVLPNAGMPHGASSNNAAPNGTVPNGAAPSSSFKADDSNGLTVGLQATAHGQEQSLGQGQGQVKFQDYAPAVDEAIAAEAARAAQQAEDAQHAQHAQQAASWAVEQLPGGQSVCVMQDGAKLTLEQLYYTLEHVGRSLPDDKYEALSMMIKQLTDRGEKYEPQSVI